MRNASKLFLAALTLSTLGLWGCNQQKTGSQQHIKIKELEERYVKLEGDHQAVMASHRQNQKKLQQLEVERTDLKLQIEDLRRLAVERDAIRTELTRRVQERDQLREHLSQLGKDLQAIMGRVETALADPTMDMPGSASVPAIPTSRSAP